MSRLVGRLVLSLVGGSRAFARALAPRPPTLTQTPLRLHDPDRLGPRRGPYRAA